MMRDYPTINFSQEILKAAVHNYAYDPQCEGSREQYIVELINLAPQKALLIPRVLQKLVEQKENTWGLSQLFDIAKLLAKSGNVEARQALYQRFESGTLPEYAYDGEYALVDLDGIEGLKHVAEVRGALLLIDYEDHEDDCLINYAQRENPGIGVEEELKKAAQNNVYITRYLAAVDEDRQREKQTPPRPVLDFEFIRNTINQKTRRWIPASAVQKLARKEIKQLADDFLLETDRSRQEMYLRLFSHVKFPHGYERLLTLAQTVPLHANTSQLLISLVNALELFKAPAIREFALTALITSNAPWIYTDLLINNYRRGDHTLLTRLVEQAKTELEIENLASSYCRIYRKNATKHCLEPLNKIYHHMNCGIHREDVVEILLRRGVLPNKIRDEIPFDSNTSVRELLNLKQT